MTTQSFGYRYESDRILLEAMQLENQEARLRSKGWFNEAVSCQGLARALREGQLTVRQLHTSSALVRCLAGQCIGL